MSGVWRDGFSQTRAPERAPPAGVQGGSALQRPLVASPAAAGPSDSRCPDSCPMRRFCLLLNFISRSHTVGTLSCLSAFSVRRFCDFSVSSLSPRGCVPGGYRRSPAAARLGCSQAGLAGVKHPRAFTYSRLLMDRLMFSFLPMEIARIDMS